MHVIRYLHFQDEEITLEESFIKFLQLNWKSEYVFVGTFCDKLQVVHVLKKRFTTTQHLVANLPFFIEIFALFNKKNQLNFCDRIR